MIKIFSLSYLQKMIINFIIKSYICFCNIARFYWRIYIMINMFILDCHTLLSRNSFSYIVVEKIKNIPTKIEMFSYFNNNNTTQTVSSLPNWFSDKKIKPKDNNDKPVLASNWFKQPRVNTATAIANAKHFDINLNQLCNFIKNDFSLPFWKFESNHQHLLQIIRQVLVWY